MALTYLRKKKNEGDWRDRLPPNIFLPGRIRGGVHTVYAYQRPANGNEDQYTQTYRQGFTARKPARVRRATVESRRARRAARTTRERASAAARVAGRGVGCVYLGVRRQRAICSCCCSGGSAVVSAMPPARSRRSILWTVRTSGRASLCRHRLQQMQARTLACTRMHECTRAPMPPHAAHCTPQTLRTPRSKLQLVPEQLVLLKGGHGADLATGARDPVAAKLARLPRRAAHAHVQLLQPPPGTRSSGIEQPSP